MTQFIIAIALMCHGGGSILGISNAQKYQRKCVLRMVNCMNRDLLKLRKPAENFELCLSEVVK